MVFSGRRNGLTPSFVNPWSSPSLRRDPAPLVPYQSPLPGTPPPAVASAMFAGSSVRVIAGPMGILLLPPTPWTSTDPPPMVFMLRHRHSAPLPNLLPLAHSVHISVHRTVSRRPCKVPYYCLYLRDMYCVDLQRCNGSSTMCFITISSVVLGEPLSLSSSSVQERSCSLPPLFWSTVAFYGWAISRVHIRGVRLGQQKVL